jgi:dTMP kinase
MVKPLLENDTTVILDRYYDSTIAYQGHGRSSLPLKDIHKLNEIASHYTVPDITFYLKISLEEAQNRTAKKLKDRMEQSGKVFYKKVIEGFDLLAESEKRIVAVDATAATDHIHQVIWEEMLCKFENLSTS